MPKTMAEPLYPLLSLSRLRMGIDGEGVTTLVAGAGCPLHCRWCINKQILREPPRESLTVAELLERVRIDDLYFQATGGGVTFGGGESLLHADFIRRFRELCPKEWRLTAETSLAVPWEQLRAAIPAIDLFLVDCKDMDSEIYRQYTGGDPALMQKNLKELLSAVGPEKIIVRVPRIPRFNTSENQLRSAQILRQLGVTKLDLFDYVIREENE